MCLYWFNDRLGDIAEKLPAVRIPDDVMGKAIVTLSILYDVDALTDVSDGAREKLDEMQIIVLVMANSHRGTRNGSFPDLEPLCEFLTEAAVRFEAVQSFPFTQAEEDWISALVTNADSAMRCHFLTFSMFLYFSFFNL